MHKREGEGTMYKALAEVIYGQRYRMMYKDVQGVIEKRPSEGNTLIGRPKQVLQYLNPLNGMFGYCHALD